MRRWTRALPVRHVGFPSGTLCAAGQFLNGDGTCVTGFLDADGTDAYNSAFDSEAEIDAAVANNNYSTGAHTIDTNAGTMCGNGTFLNGDGTCDSADGSGTCTAGRVCTGGHTHPATQVTAGTMSIGDNDYTHSIKTGYYHVSGGSFNVHSSNAAYYQDYAYMRPNNGAGSDVEGTAPLDVPDRATITRVTGYYYDNGAVAPNPTYFCGVARRSLDTAGSIVVANQTTIINWVNSTTAVRQADSPVVGVFVDKSANNYFLLARLLNTDGSSNFRHYGCRVTYTYTNTNN